VVIVYQDSHEEKYLCAYIVPTLENAFWKYFFTGTAEYLTQKLPDYMIPLILSAWKKFLESQR